ncbi:MAG: hypothetical protein HY553_11380 [Elusimicrobia bacterium]|nr:hypothetical protein [Elusimicrobiota bacterium]
MPSHQRTAAILFLAALLVGGAAVVGLRSRWSGSSPSRRLKTANPSARPGALAPAPLDEEEERSGLELVSGSGIRFGGPARYGSSASGIATVDAGGGPSGIASRLREALELGPMEGLGEPEYDPSAATEAPAEPSAEAATDEKGRRGPNSRDHGSASAGRSGTSAAGETAGPMGTAGTPAEPSPAGMLLSMFKPADRTRLLTHLEGGKGFVSACKASGLAAQCMSAGQACTRQAACGRWLNGQLTAHARAKAGDAELAGGDQVGGVGAQVGGFASGYGAGETNAAGREKGLGSGGGRGSGAARSAVKTAKKDDTPEEALTPSPRPTPTPTRITIRLPFGGTLTIPTFTPTPTPRPAPITTPVEKGNPKYFLK